MENIILEQKVVSSDNYNISIGVYISDKQLGFFLDPYFKVYNHKNQVRATRVARISILRPEYITSHTTGDVPNYKLNSKEIGFMLKCLRDPVVINNINHTSGWDFICNFITREANIRNINVNYIGMKMPDYSKLK